MTPEGFWDGVATKYAERAIGNPEAYQTSLARVRSHLHQTDRMLELGCGTGGTARLLAPDVAEIVATDISDAMLEIAKARTTKESVDNVTYLRASPEENLPQGPFDTVTAFNLVHLLKDRDGALARVHGALKPGGLFISKTPCMGGIYALLWPVIGVMRLFGKAPYLSFVTPSRLEASITHAGFEIIETGDYPKRPPSHFIVARKL